MAEDRKTAKRNLQVCFSPQLFELYYDKSSIVVVADIFRATSAICTAFQYGAEAILPVATIQEALFYRTRGYLAGGERDGEIVKGFEFGNSPFSFMHDKIKGGIIALTTTNGTRAIQMAKHAETVVIGAFLNLGALSKWLLEQNRDVIVLCAGWKNRFNLEDAIFAGALSNNLLESGNFQTDCDSTLTSELLYSQSREDLYNFLERSSHRNRLHRLHLEEDVKYCLCMDKTEIIPRLKGERLICEMEQYH